MQCQVYRRRSKFPRRDIINVIIIISSIRILLPSMRIPSGGMTLVFRMYFCSYSGLNTQLKAGLEGVDFNFVTY